MIRLFFLALIVGALGFTVQIWLVMLSLGAIHHSISASIPALGFNTTLWVCVIVNFFHSVSGQTGSNEK